MKKLLLIVPCLAIACTNDLGGGTVHEPGADEDGASFVVEADDELSADGWGAERESPFEFVRLGLRFTSDDVDAVDVRTSVDGETWSDWAQPTIVFSEGAAHAGHVDAPVSSRFFQHRVLAGREVPTFMVLEPIAVVGDAPADGDVAVDAQAATAEEQGLNLDIVSRSGWGARAPRCRDGTGVSKATVHHTAGPNDDRTPVTVQLRQIQAFHMVSRGWCDIAYNFLVSRDGRVFEGRGYGVLGAHVENDNTNNMGVNFIGTYETVAPPLAQQIAGAKVLRYLHDRGGIPLSRTHVNGVKGHRQRGTTATSCPGAKLYGLLGSIVTRAARKDFDEPPQGPCATKRFDGAFCDDENHGNEAAHDRLVRGLDVDFHCSDKQGSNAFCPTADATRKDAIFVLGAAADMPTRGHPDAFPDDNGKREGWFNAAKAFGIVNGINGRAAPDSKVSRSSMAVMIARMYHLPATNRDFFDDDDGHAAEDAHNRVAAAGLMNGSADGNGRRDFKPRTIARRTDLAVLAGRAKDARLRPVWDIPEGCRGGPFNGAFCDDDGTGSGADNDALVDAGVAMPWAEVDGKPMYQADKEVSRGAAIYMLTQAEGIPLAGHPDAFDDDNSHDRERWFNAAHALGLVNGFDGEVRPTAEANRDMIAIVLSRMYALPASDVDAFTDDDGTNMEPWHNKVAAAGLIAGYDNGRGGREFRGTQIATRGALSTVLGRATRAGLVAKWNQ